MTEEGKIEKSYGQNKNNLVLKTLKTRALYLCRNKTLKIPE